METDKQYQPMTESEKKTLRRGLRFLLGIVLFFVLPWVISSVFLLFSFAYGWVGFVGIGVDLLLTWFVFNKFYVKQPANQDIIFGQKIVARTNVQHKREDSSGYSSSYLITALNHEFRVSNFTIWKDLQVGQRIEIHFAPESKYVFQLTALPS